jgi:hypothetical protein
VIVIISAKIICEEYPASKYQTWKCLPILYVSCPSFLCFFSSPLFFLLAASFKSSGSFGVLYSRPFLPHLNISYTFPPISCTNLRSSLTAGKKIDVFLGIWIITLEEARHEKE